MVIKTLYRYVREGGGTTVSTEKPDTEYTEVFRIIADEGKVLTQNGTDLCQVIDVNTTDGWYEVDDPANLNRQYTETDEPIEQTELES